MPLLCLNYRIENQKQTAKKVTMVNNFISFYNPSAYYFTHIYNFLISTKLLLEDINWSYLLQIFWNLLPLNADGSKREGASHNSNDYKDAFDKSLIKRFREGIFTKEEIVRISKHASLFFKHFLLYDFVFNNAKPSDIKKIVIAKDIP